MLFLRPHLPALLTLAATLPPMLSVQAVRGIWGAPPPSEAAVPNSAARDRRALDLEKVLAEVREEHGVPALGAVLLEGDSIRARAAVGVRRAGGNEAVTVDDSWHFGPCAKPLTATLFATLVQRGELSWETTLGEAFRDAGFAVAPEFHDVTLEMVLAHRAGLPYLPRAALREALDHTGLNTEFQRLRIAEDVLGRSPVRPPGTQPLYSNAGYCIVGSAIEILIGTRFEILLQREVLDPLGMDSVGFGAPGNAAFVDEPWGHRVREDGLEPCPPGPDADLPAGFAPAGTMHGQLDDWALFAALHLATPSDPPSLLTEESLARLHAPSEGSPYALGWVTSELADGGPMLTHSGSNLRWFASIVLLPDRDAAILVSCNQGGVAGAAACRDVVEKMLPHTSNLPVVAVGNAPSPAVSGNSVPPEEL